MLPTSEDMEERRRPSLHGYKKRYEVNEINLLTSGDILLLYTDGLSEHGDGRYFPERLEALLAELRDRPAATICESIRTDLLAFATPGDDVSVVVIRKSE